MAGWGIEDGWGIREREQGTPFLGQCAPASLTAHGEPQKDRWILGDFDAMGSAAPPCLSHLPPPSCWLVTPDRSHGKLGRTLTLWSKPSLSGPAAWLEGVNCGAPWGRAWMLLCLRAELPPPEDRSQGTISLLHLQPLPQVAHPLLPLISSGSECNWEAGTQRLSGGRGSLARRLGEEPETAAQNEVRSLTSWVIWALPPPASL